MDAGLKTKWIKALRSGRYKQATGELQAADGSNCCLGVLCRVAGAHHRGREFWIGKTLVGDWADIVEEGMLRFGLRQVDCNKLVRLNDRDGKPFPKIADYIEKNL